MVVAIVRVFTGGYGSCLDGLLGSKNPLIAADPQMRLETAAEGKG
jgi:hypothetical protein